MRMKYSIIWNDGWTRKIQNPQLAFYFYSHSHLSGFFPKLS